MPPCPRRPVLKSCPAFRIRLASASAIMPAKKSSASKNVSAACAGSRNVRPSRAPARGARCRRGQSAGLRATPWLAVVRLELRGGGTEQFEWALAAATPAARLGCARRAARALPAHADDRCADGACRTPFSCAAMSPRVLAAVRHVAGEGRACQSIWRRVDDGGASATGRLHGSVILSYAYRPAMNALFHVSLTQNDGGDCKGMRGSAGMADSPCLPAAGLDGGRQPKI